MLGRSAENRGLYTKFGIKHKKILILTNHGYILDSINFERGR